MVASTNHLDKLDAGLSSRPSRFDRKYRFPLPSEDERTLYCQYWRAKVLKRKVDVDFPEKICSAAATITDGFSFAYMQEAFVATLLAIALRRSEMIGEGLEKSENTDRARVDENKNLNDYELWRVMKETIKTLRDDMGKTPKGSSINDDPLGKDYALEKEAQAPSTRTNPGASAPVTHESQLPIRTLNDGGEGFQKTPSIRGLFPKVDHDGVPIITDNNFVYSAQEGKMTM